MERKNIWNLYSDEQISELKEINDKYKRCLDAGKTERECVELSVNMARDAGYRDLEEILRSGETLKAGDKVYAVNMNKMLALFRIGERPISEGMNILGAHIDSPRIDVKQNPLYENEELAYLDTHYYGGIKKYQWVAQPLALHGVIVKKASQVIEGEKLDLLIGNRAIEKADDLKKEEKDAVKQNVLNILKEMYGIDEEDFYSAELEIVPAGKARDCGLDRSMNLSYGQDDRVCAFTSLFAMLDVTEAKKTGCCLLVDKEEIGSVGATGMHSRFFENTVAELIAVTEGESELKVRRALSNSKMLSSDVSAAFDPMFAEAFEKRSSAFFANGITFNKFTGSRGKSGSNDANGEYIAALRRTMDEAQVAYQFAELGRVDLGGGGTIAYIMANYGMEVIDSGVAVLNMHAPYEVSSKADVYEAVKGYRAFLRME